MAVRMAVCHAGKVIIVFIATAIKTTYVHDFGSTTSKYLINHVKMF